MNAIRRLLIQWAETQLSTDELERIRMVPTRQNEYGFDPFGFHRDDVKLALVMARFLYRHYFRCQAFGLENIPRGRAMLVANHSGQLPFDGMMIAAAVFFEGNPPRIARSMLEHFVPSWPFISSFFSRCGQVVGTPENCLRLLEDEELLCVFPEGIEGISKPFTERYQLKRFGIGFMRLCIEARAPVVPVAVIGAEEQAPGINLRSLARRLHLPTLPIAPPLPLPARYRIYFGEPQRFDAAEDEEDEVVEALVRRVRLTIESMLQVGLKERKSIFL